MELMLAEVYDALLEAGASEEKARKAAIAVASFDDRLRSLATQAAETQRRLEHVITELRVFGGITITLVCSFGFGILWRVWR